MKKSPQPHTAGSATPAIRAGRVPVSAPRPAPRIARQPAPKTVPVPEPVPVSVPVPKVLPSDAASWTFLTNHTHVLLCLYRDPDQRLREVAQAVGITERMVQRIVAELVEGGYLTISKEGRCNRYNVLSTLRLRHPLEMQHTIGELLTLLSPIAS